MLSPLSPSFFKALTLKFIQTGCARPPSRHLQLDWEMKIPMKRQNRNEKREREREWMLPFLFIIGSKRRRRRNREGKGDEEKKKFSGRLERSPMIVAGSASAPALRLSHRCRFKLFQKKKAHRTSSSSTSAIRSFKLRKKERKEANYMYKRSRWAENDGQKTLPSHRTSGLIEFELKRNQDYSLLPLLYLFRLYPFVLLFQHVSRTKTCRAGSTARKGGAIGNGGERNRGQLRCCW